MKPKRCAWRYENHQRCKQSALPDSIYCRKHQSETVTVERHRSRLATVARIYKKKTVARVAKKPAGKRLLRATKVAAK